MLSVYLLIFLLSNVLFDYSKILGKTRAAVLSRLMPTNFDYLVSMMSSPRELTKIEPRALLSDVKDWIWGEVGIKSLNEKDVQLKNYLQYYETVSKYMPQRADVFGLLGFCYYQKGQPRKAIDAYKKDVELNPHFFWSQYNLGLIYYKEGQYRNAIRSFEKALQTRADRTLKYLSYSKLYQDIVRKEAMSIQGLKEKLKEGYLNSHTLIILSHYHLENYSDLVQLANLAMTLNLDFQDKFYYYAGRAAYAIHDYHRSIFFLKECIDRNPNHADAYLYLGLSLKEVGRMDFAVKNFKKAQILSKVNAIVQAEEEELHPQIF